MTLPKEKEMNEKITPGIMVASVCLGVYLALILHSVTVWMVVTIASRF